MLGPLAIDFTKKISSRACLGAMIAPINSLTMRSTQFSTTSSSSSAPRAPLPFPLKELGSRTLVRRIYFVLPACNPLITRFAGKFENSLCRMLRKIPRRIVREVPCRILREILSRILRKIPRRILRKFPRWIIRKNPAPVIGSIVLRSAK